MGPEFLPFGSAALGLFALMSTLARVALLCVLASLVVLVAHDHVDRVGARAIAEPVKAGVIGLLAQLLFLPLLVITILVLVVTIIGIPLLVLIPFALLALAVFGLVGFTAIAVNLGRLVQSALRVEQSESLPDGGHRHHRADLAGPDCAVDRAGRRAGVSDHRHARVHRVSRGISGVDGGIRRGGAAQIHAAEWERRPCATACNRVKSWA